MKRPIAELRTVTVHAGAEAEWLHDEHEAWQILRRKPGYVAHRLYQGVREPHRRLVYSEWDSKKALDGARQLLRGTPLGRRARAVLDAGPERLVVELVGPVTSTKGLVLPDTAVALSAMARAAASSTTHEQHVQLGKQLASQPGHITHVLFRGFDDPVLVGAFSHWQDATALEAAIAGLASSAPMALLEGLAYVQYKPVRPSSAG
jgi:heme-degrading monooxygenase HmoA